MNEEKLRIAIHRARGKCPHTELEKWTHQNDWGFDCKECGEDPHCEQNRVPNYLASRDAAISAVIELCDTKDKQEFFLMYLFRFAEKPENFSVITATASQICQALAKTLNLNVEE